MTTRTDTTFTYTWLLLSLDLIADFIVDADFGLRTRCGLFLAVENARGFGFADRLRLAHRAEEARDLGRILDEVIDIIGHRQLGEDITGEEFAFGLNLLAALHLGDGLDRHLDRFDEFGETHAFGFGKHRIANLVLETRIGVNEDRKSTRLNSSH